MKEKLEKYDLHIGIVALCDCAPLVIAKEKNFFASAGLNVKLSIEPSWANIRDKITFGVFDAAQMLAPMPLASTLGLEGLGQAMTALTTLSRNGNGITLSHALYDTMTALNPASPIDALNQAIQSTISRYQRPMRFAIVHPYSCHHYLLKQWLQSQGVDIEKDVQFLVIPPRQMVSDLHRDRIDGFCVGAPWNTVAEAYHLGITVVYSHEIILNLPEKVLGTSQAWAQKFPNVAQTLVQCLTAASEWMARPENHAECLSLLASEQYIDVGTDILSQAFKKAYPLVLADFKQTMEQSNESDMDWIKQQVLLGQSCCETD
jgi:ABC-type nitrate/sulfonate/bicarbonate transport system substrate-binding protein